ncbi:sulfite exporter TauE/SafE family protein [Aquipuribacter sp. MA13-6]|uniref:sulfite exporter TauE/SafE family protein n=1 Tax=unclassified Aquipuribacter TaxID=2635084 RepID=UPI003EEDF77E
MTEPVVLSGVLVVAVLLGSAAQRVTGVGFALVVSPFAVLAHGAQGGVVVVCVVGASGATVVLALTRRDVDVPVLRRLLLPAGLGVVLGAALLAVLPPGPAQAAAGGAVVLGVLAAAVAGRFRPVAPGRRVLWLAGTASGTMSALAGLAGPALAVLALMTRWPQARFVATVQPYFVIVGAGTVAAIVLTDASAWPTVSSSLWLALGAAMLLGTSLGHRAQPFLPGGWVRAGVLAVSLAGGLVAVADGLFG